MEGVKCLVYGRPNVIPKDKIGLYSTYASTSKYIKKGDGTEKYEFVEKDVEEVQKSMEMVV